MTADPALCIELNGRRLKPVSSQPGRCVFALPGTCGAARLISRTAAPSDLRPWLGDQRLLGVMVKRMTLQRDGSVQTIPTDCPDMNNGWWDEERDESRTWRWTNGAAELALPPGGPALLEVQFGTVASYSINEVGATVPTHPQIAA
jgi:hypothetical protein